jgi:phenylalanyl-tRNA synthetase beta chain
MKVTLNWLQRYVEFDWSPDELRERLTMLGVEVEGCNSSVENSGIVVAQVLTRRSTPTPTSLRSVSR